MTKYKFFNVTKTMKCFRLKKYHVTLSSQLTIRKMIYSKKIRKMIKANILSN
jgi:uncharacterized ubiquitin-like protein YukD